MSDFPSGQTLVPYFAVAGAGEAIDFYKAAFGAVESGARITDGSGKVGHAELTIGNSKLYLADEHPEYGMVSANTLGGCPVMFQVLVKDTDAMVKRAVDACAEVIRPVEDQFYGYRMGSVKCPFGIQWSISHHIEDVSDEELQRRAKEMYGG